MTSSLRTSELLSEFLDHIDPDAPPGNQGRKMMEQKLRWYVHKWQRRQTERKLESKPRPPFTRTHSTTERGTFAVPAPVTGREDEISAALKKKDQVRQAQAASRRRMRGGAPTAAVSSIATSSNAATGQADVTDDTERLAALYVHTECTALRC